MKIKLLFLFMFVALIADHAIASKIFIPMDATGQANHLKAYGIAYGALQQGIKVDWLLNYKGGSFVIPYSQDLEDKCTLRGVKFTKMSNADYAVIVKKIANPHFNGEIVKLEKAPKIAVYTPLNKEPWDDAVTLALTYAEIPFDKIYADEVLAGALDKYDWLHLHHEDFTGQYGKFWANYRNAEWYRNDKRTAEQLAVKNGFKKVSQMQLAVVKKIKAFVADGGNMFAMCSATETFDIALAADGVDICDTPFDGDRMDPLAQGKLDFSKCFAFKDFLISTSQYEYGHSNIDNTITRSVPADEDFFDLSVFPAKLDHTPAMLCQDHVSHIRGFMGQTTAFRGDVIKPGVTVMGGFKPAEQKRTASNGTSYTLYDQKPEARYIHGEYEKGTWTFLGGHDPEDYRHLLGNPATDLARHPTSPGYRLILNNVLCPAAKKQLVPTVVIGDSVSNASTAPVAMNNVPTLADRVKIYPNPTGNELIISCTEKILHIDIYNQAGAEVFSRAYNSDKVGIDMGSLPSGIFLIKVNGEYAGKVVKN